MAPIAKYDGGKSLILKKVKDKMDILQLTTLLSSCLPLLLKFGDKVAESAGGALGKDVNWETIKKIWDQLRPKAEAKPDVMKVVAAVVADPDDQDFKDVLQKKLEKLLEENRELKEAIAQILQEETISSQVNIAVKGDNSGVIGGNIQDSKVFGSVDIQGDINM